MDSTRIHFDEDSIFVLLVVQKGDIDEEHGVKYRSWEHASHKCDSGKSNVGERVCAEKAKVNKRGTAEDRQIPQPRRAIQEA